jgi:hypothetical protein
MIFSKEEIQEKIDSMYVTHYARIDANTERFGCIDEILGRCEHLIDMMEPPERPTDYLCFLARKHVLLLHDCPRRSNGLGG